ncbi:MAG TPA: aminodeoxychorismate synthase component I [Baekduia sp.]|uniref:aminodeoxychorismate synthase component I n=1 Tax=Baekduia sp. TaxID=2600305 RepID=UPI002D7A1ECF|nr:aminodeoxychorismate synthase component I [Baekduia sp.]HET6508466.1 aminodeoxychorismate synthase component I [Baekduia sp.]
MTSSSLLAPATAGAVARAVRVALPGDVPAARAGLLVRDDARPFALVGRWAGARAICGSEPLRVLDAAEDPLAALDVQPPVDGAVPEGFVGGGWFGALGYGLGRELEPTLGPPPPVTAAERLPDAPLAFHDHVLLCDADGRWWFEALWTDARADVLTARREELAARLARGVGDGPRPFATGRWRATPSPEGHARAVAACRERIAEGDLFQANLALRLRATLDGDAVDLFTTGVEALAPDRAAWLSGPWGAVASLSPELFLTRRGDVVTTAPIKGTRPRPADPEAAEAQRAALAASPKDRAENVMIVDLMRNDLGRVCEPGTVRVDALAEARPHAGVWHLVSEVSGRLRAGVGDAALLRATFPPGSVTGAPKVAAMDAISALESAARQTFCGAIGFASPTAGLELSVAIRTFETTGAAAWLDVGGGIVADSDPAAEAAEALAKAAPLLAAIGAAAPDAAIAVAPPPGAGSRPLAAVPAPLRLAAQPVPRPDPDAGVFETILVADGAPVALDGHLARLRSAARDLYDVALPPATEALVRHTALEQGGPCRLRVLLDADGQVGLQVAPLPDAAPVRLRATTVPGGLGDRKWRDRRLIDALEEALDGEHPLMADLDGTVLETTRANVFAWIDDALVTPPLDGRVLPGVTRGRVIALADRLGLRVHERPLALAELRAAHGVLLTGALRGPQPVEALDGVPLAAPDDRLRTLAGRFTRL